MRTRHRLNTARAAAVLALAWASLGGASIQRANHDGTPVFTDNRGAETRRVYTYEQADGVPAFTDRIPLGHKYRLMEFSCYACNPNSKIQWRSTSLHTTQYTSLIAAAARDHGVDTALIRAIIHAESGFDPNARSNKGAIGLMQLMPGTAADMGVANINAAADNIKGGVKYLAMLLSQFKGDIALATAAYHAGPSSVTRFGGIPPFQDTQIYVKRVKILLDRYRAKG